MFYKINNFTKTCDIPQQTVIHVLLFLFHFLIIHYLSLALGCVCLIKNKSNHYGKKNIDS